MHYAGLDDYPIISLQVKADIMSVSLKTAVTMPILCFFEGSFMNLRIIIAKKKLKFS